MRHAMQLHDRRSRIGNSNGLLVPPARRQRLARSAYGAPSPPRPSGPIARRSAARLWLEQNLRSSSHPLQSRQDALWTCEDELSLAWTPRVPSIEALTLHDEVGHQAERHMVLLRPLSWHGLLLGGPLVTCWTSLQAQLTFPYPTHLFHLLALPGERPDLLAVRRSRGVA